jgi:hypothetical protein
MTSVGTNYSVIHSQKRSYQKRREIVTHIQTLHDTQ